MAATKSAAQVLRGGTRSASQTRAARTLAALDEWHADSIALLDELEQIAAPDSVRRQIKQRTSGIRRNIDTVQSRILQSEYFRDAYPLATLRLMQSARHSETALERTSRRKGGPLTGLTFTSMTTSPALST